ncbi:MAG: hypothetical protein ACREU7_08410 [Burkholderiales bacterium]
MAETLFHILPQRRIERPAGTRKNTVNTNRRPRHRPIRLSREALDAWWGSVNVKTHRRRHYLTGNPVRFPFQQVITRTDHELTLQTKLLLAAFRALTRNPWRSAAGTFALH